MLQLTGKATEALVSYAEIWSWLQRKYKALARPQLEYAAPISNPHHQTEINTMEKVQRGLLLDGPVDVGVTRVTLEKC